ncbi:MAG: hypothetical protein J5715_01635 [Clostridiales bacterium]|nr:hypothetical protein [Clostridiales bacterium]
MDFTYSNDGFLPYESFDYIYGERQMPEFGRVKSPFITKLTTWRFLHVDSLSQVPIGCHKKSYDDSDWALIDVPSTWQTEGYGMPQNLLYDYSEVLASDKNKREETMSDKYYLKSTSDEDDETGIYRAEVTFTPKDIDRALYLEASGICGQFRVYINDKLVCKSHSVLTAKRLLISDFVHEGVNLIVIIVSRFDRDSRGHVITELMNFGFSGIFRPISIVSESLLEIRNLHLQLEYVPEAYVTQIAKIDQIEKTVAKNPRGDFMIKVDFGIRNHTDYMIPYSVRISLLEARGEYDPYKLPFVNIRGQGEAITGVVDAGMETRAQTDFMALDVAQWSDATPVQYDLILELTDSEGTVICAKKQRFGFRTTEIVNDKLNINDRRVNLKLTKYYEFDPMGGIAVNRALERQDVILMKRCGLNGVIVNSFPVSDDFLNLCDQYGIYVIATAGAYYMRDYVESAMNHPSIVMWGVQDYGFNEDYALRAKQECSNIDKTRPWYCAAEGNSDGRGIVSDIKPFPTDAGVVFGPWEDLCLDRKNMFSKNKTGKNLFESIKGRTRFTDDDADYKWIHHADLVGGKNKENSSIGQGIVDANRNPHPIYADIRQQCANISIFAAAGDRTNLTFRNIHPFAYTDEMELEWKILLGGNAIMSGRGLMQGVEPFGTRNLRFPITAEMFTTPGWGEGKAEYIDAYMNAMSHELVFDISLKLAHDTYYAKEGYEVVFYQDILAKEAANPVSGKVKDDVLKIDPGKEELPEGMNAPQALPAADSSDISKETATDETAVEEEEDTGVASVMDDAEIEKIAGQIIGAEAPKTEETEEVTEVQYEQKDVSDPNLSLAEEKLTVYADPSGVSVAAGKFRIGFSRATGGVNSLMIDGTDFLAGSFMPSFYRCPSNIDRTDKSFILAKTIFSGESDYENIQKTLRYKSSEYSVKNGVFSMITSYKSFAMKGDVVMFYEIPSEDTLRITMDFTPRYDMIRYGVRVPIVKKDTLCTWYGRGPGESYVDRKNAARLGVYAAGADKIYHPYARPAENSSHTDTQVVKIENSEGSKLMIRRSGPNARFDFTVLPYTPEQMNEYLHEEQLMMNDSGELFLDFCSKEIERTVNNRSSQPLKKNVNYRETFEIKLVK